MVDVLLKERRLTVVESVPAARSGLGLLAALAGLCAAYLALFACAAYPTPWGAVVAAAAVAVAETAWARPGLFLTWGLRRAALDDVARGLVRGAALVLLAARTLPDHDAVAVTGLVVVTALLRALRTAGRQAVDYLRTPAVTGRNLDLRLPPIPAAPHPRLTGPAGWSPASDVLIALAVASWVEGSTAGAVVALVAAAAVAAVAPAVLAAHALTLHRRRIRPRVTAAVLEALAELRPRVVAYLGNGAEWRYQLEMWLRTLEAVPGPVLLLVRDHEVLRTLAPTRLPVVCIPGGTLLMQLPMPDLQAALYVGNTANNIHLLRRPDVRTVFIGHGDSDKGASANPFSRVYDEIWVAGPAGRARYRAAGVDIPDSAFVEIGRPQLGELGRIVDEVPRLTVLYAPTFEGFGEDPHHTSLPHAGVAIIRALLARGDVRVMYRPHPRTGHRDPATRAAHLEIIRMLRGAGAPAPQDGPVGPPPTAVAALGRDVLDLMAAGPSGWTPEEHERAVAAWTASYWATSPGHRILMPPAPDLHASFTAGDALIADISSVTSDFLATDRPYAVVNTSGLPAELFRGQSPSAAGGFVLEPDLEALDALITAAAGGPDPTAGARAAARRDLLGPRTADPAERFRLELDRLCRRRPRPEAGRLVPPDELEVS